MAKANFDACLKLMLQFEGGYADNPADPGGATNFGITRAALASHRGHPVTKQDVLTLQHKEVVDIYRSAYWQVIGGDDLPAGIDAAVFDHAVNSGPGAAGRSVRRVLGYGGAGPFNAALIAAIAKQNPENLIKKLCADRLASLQRLPHFPTFGRGWTRRVNIVEATALKMCAAWHVQARNKPNMSVTDKNVQEESPEAMAHTASPPKALESNMKLQGYRTFIVGFSLALAPAALQYFGAVDWNTLIGPTGAFFVSGMIAILMRAVTTTRPGEQNNA